MSDNQNKVLLMGKANAGKTSMRSIIFANYLARDTFRLGATVGVDHSSLRFLDNLTLNLWDCGGQKKFLVNYFHSQKQQIFRGVKILIFVFDVESITNEANQSADIDEFETTVQNVEEFNPDARVFVLIHKMDLIPDEDLDQTVTSVTNLIDPHIPTSMQREFFTTSIWDESLFQAWSKIVRSLIPRLGPIKQALQQLCTICESDEIVIFEKHTFLVVCQAERKEMRDKHRLEKVSNVVKAFKLRCGHARGQTVDSIQVSNSLFQCVIMDFTKTTSIMVINSPSQTQDAAIISNLVATGKNFEKLFATMHSI